MPRSDGFDFKTKKGPMKKQIKQTARGELLIYPLIMVLTAADKYVIHLQAWLQPKWVEDLRGNNPERYHSTSA